MDNVMIFEDKKVEVFELNGQVLFNPKHVADCLGISDVNSAIRNFNNKQVVKLKNSDMCNKHIQNSNIQNMNIRKLNNAGENFLTESGVYKLIFKSRKPNAEKFQDWVTDEVLPSIRKHGAYLTPEKIEETLTNPDTIIQLAKILKEEQLKSAKLTKENEKLNKKIMLQEPKVIFAEAVKESKNSIYIGDLARILKQNGFDIGQSRLFDLLRRKGYLYKNKDVNIPTQKSMDLGLFEIIMSNTKGKVNKTVFVTGKGQLYFINLFINKNRERVIETVDIKYVYENQNKEYFINYEEIRKYMLENYGDEPYINEIMDDIDIWIDTIPDKKDISEVTSGREIIDIFKCISASLKKENRKDFNINIGLVAC